MKCCASPWSAVLLYISGMLFAILGITSLIISIDPRPFDSNTSVSFLAAGICFLVVGGILIVLTIAVPEYPGRVYVFRDNPGISHTSEINLLNDVQSVHSSDSPIVKLREAALRTTEESVRTVKSCMMMQPSGSSGIVFYKETVV